MKTVGVSDLETGEANDDITSDFEEGTCCLLNDSEWTPILVIKPHISFLNERGYICLYRLSVSCYHW